MNSEKYVIGIDFGSDSARAVIVNCADGSIVGESVSFYKRWKQGLFCDPLKSQFRHHPQDYIDAIESAVGSVTSAHPEEARNIVALSVDTTGSTPCFVDENLVPLSLKPEFSENPDAMFILWKDHTGTDEAARIEAACHANVPDYTMLSGFAYSPEAYWSKALHVLRTSPQVREAYFTAIELCDWIPALLTGCHNIDNFCISHSCVGEKSFWCEKWGGYPPVEFFEKIDPVLVKLRKSLSDNDRTPDVPVGNITDEWADRLGVPHGIVIGAGNIDSFSGSFGSGVEEGVLVMSFGTSAAYTTVFRPETLDNVIDGVMGQVDGLITPKMIGIETGLSAYGDVYAWLKRLIMTPVNNILADCDVLPKENVAAIADYIDDKMMLELNRSAERVSPNIHNPFATDFLNGRRAPASNMRLWGSLMGLKLSTDAGAIFRSLVEATSFASKVIIDGVESAGLKIDKVIATGGIAQKSPLAVQMVADVLNKEIEICSCKQSGALGAAIFAAAAAGVYPDFRTAQRSMIHKNSKVYYPDSESHKFLLKRFGLYMKAVDYTEKVQEEFFNFDEID